MKNLFVFLLLFPTSVFALSVDYPTVILDGVTYYIADSDDKTGDYYMSQYGYCEQKGLYFVSSESQSDPSLLPIAVLDAEGKVVQTITENSDGDIWVVSQLICEESN